MLLRMAVVVVAVVVAQHLTLFREEKKRNGSLSYFLSLSLSVYRLPYPNSLESLPNQLIGKNGEL